MFNKVNLCEEVAVSMFIGGLKKEIQSVVSMLQRRYLREAYSLARRQEENYNNMCAAMMGGKPTFHSVSKESFVESKSLSSFGAKFSTAKPIQSATSCLFPLLVQ